MISEDFDRATLANMHEALDHVSKQFPMTLLNHEGRREVACMLMDIAKGGQTTLQPLTEAAVSVASSLVDREAATSNPDRNISDRANMPAAGPHARSDLIDYEKTPGCGMFPNQEDTNPSPTG
jgi:hypothetical protein